MKNTTICMTPSCTYLPLCTMHMAIILLFGVCSHNLTIYNIHGEESPSVRVHRSFYSSHTEIVLAYCVFGLFATETICAVRHNVL